MNQRPNHIGVILDGNRRFAKKNGLGYLEAYGIAARKVTDLIRWILIENRADILSLYALSLDNLNGREQKELQPIYDVQIEAYQTWLESGMMLESRIRVVFAGELSLLPESYRSVARNLEQQTIQCKEKTLYILAAYSGEKEIQRAAKSNSFPKSLKVAEPVDLVIRTAGEQRLSDFLPYQTRYAEFIFLDCLFPEIALEDIEEALKKYSLRVRKFGT